MASKPEVNIERDASLKRYEITISQNTVDFDNAYVMHWYDDGRVELQVMPRRVIEQGLMEGIVGAVEEAYSRPHAFGRV